MLNDGLYREMLIFVFFCPLLFLWCFFFIWLAKLCHCARPEVHYVQNLFHSNVCSDELDMYMKGTEDEEVFVNVLCNSN